MNDSTVQAHKGSMPLTPEGEPVEEIITKLPNAPLLEVIFEFHWKLEELPGDRKIDPLYSLLVGKLYDELKDDYPFHEQLPTADIPAEIASYVTQHRFRNTEEGWPLVQLGPGVLTVNDAADYEWTDFRERIARAVSALSLAYESLGGNLTPNAVQLRYIDGLPFEFEKEDVFAFLDSMLKVKVELYEKLFEDGRTSKTPKAIDLKFFFDSKDPTGDLVIRFARGISNGEGALLWETVVAAVQEAMPGDVHSIGSWVDDAHQLVHDWFIRMTEGPLMETFK